MKRLLKFRRSRGLTQRELAEQSGVSPATINELEHGRRNPNPSTLRKLAWALGVEVEDLTKEEEKKMIEVGYLDVDGAYRSEKLMFTGVEVDGYHEDGADRTVTLCWCVDRHGNDGYRVYSDDGSEPRRVLYPYRFNRLTGENDYPLYSPEEVARHWPKFGDAVGLPRVRDID